MARSTQRAATTGPIRPVPSARLSLLNEFQLLVGQASVSVAPGVRRLLAALGLAERPTARSRIAGQLWLDVPEWRALGNLRSALWRLHRLARPVVRSIDDRIGLEPDVEVDVAELQRLTSRIIEGADQVTPRELAVLTTASDLLPGWDDEWVIVERERLRERRLHALECVGEALLLKSDLPSAARAATAAVEIEPFRESAQRLLVRVHLQNGDRAAAMRAYMRYRQLLDEELGIGPSDLMEELLGDLPRIPPKTHRQ